MKRPSIGVALIAVALIAADFLARIPALHQTAHDQSNWAWADTLYLIMANFYYFWRAK